jgi:hypothetical protein
VTARKKPKSTTTSAPDDQPFTHPTIHPDHNRTPWFYDRNHRVWDIIQMLAIIVPVTIVLTAFLALAYKNSWSPTDIGTVVGGAATVAGSLAAYNTVKRKVTNSPPRWRPRHDDEESDHEQDEDHAG